MGRFYQEVEGESRLGRWIKGGPRGWDYTSQSELVYTCYLRVVSQPVKEGQSFQFLRTDLNKQITSISLETDMDSSKEHLSQEIHTTIEISLPEVWVNVQQLNEIISCIDNQIRLGEVVLCWVYTYVFWQDEGCSGAAVHVFAWDRIEQEVHVACVKLVQVMLGAWKVHANPKINPLNIQITVPWSIHLRFTPSLNPLVPQDPLELLQTLKTALRLNKNIRLIYWLITPS